MFSSTRAKGKHRDQQVIDCLKSWGCLDSIQIKYLFFPSDRVCQRRMKTLADNKKIKRYKSNPYIYYIDSVSIEMVLINWVRIWLDRRRSWERILDFNYKNNTATVKNTVTAQIKEYQIAFSQIKWFNENVIIVDEFLIQKIRSELHA